jgi:hypothetical protein
MKHTIKFKFPTAGSYEATVKGAHISQNRWSRALQYTFEFELTHKMTHEFGISVPEKLPEPIHYERTIQLSKDNEPLFKFLEQLHWPDLVETGDAAEFSFETDHQNNIVLPVDLPRIFQIDFTQGSTRAAQFKSITPILPQEVES